LLPLAQRAGYIDLLAIAAGPAPGSNGAAPAAAWRRMQQQRRAAANASSVTFSAAVEG